jgi:phospholipase D1/2
LVHKVLPNGDGQSAGTLQEGRTADIRTGEEPQLTSSITPTLEETVVAKKVFSIGPLNVRTEHLEPVPQQRASESVTKEDAVQIHDSGQDGQRARTSQAGIAPDGVDARDEQVAHAKSILRKHLANKLGNRSWTAPVPAVPKDPKIFEDPISDVFWYDVWVAAAVHNVGTLCHPLPCMLNLRCTDGSLSKGFPCNT